MESKLFELKALAIVALVLRHCQCEKSEVIKVAGLDLLSSSLLLHRTSVEEALPALTPSEASVTIFLRQSPWVPYLRILSTSSFTLSSCWDPVHSFLRLG